MNSQRGSATLETILAVGFLLIPAAALLAQLPQWVGTGHAAQVAANEAARAAVLSDNLQAAADAASQTATAVVTNHGHEPGDLLEVSLGGTLTRGAVVTVTVRVQGEPIMVPGIGTVGSPFVASASGTERVDDYRGFP